MYAQAHRTAYEREVKRVGETERRRGIERECEREMRTARDCVCVFRICLPARLPASTHRGDQGNEEEMMTLHDMAETLITDVTQQKIFCDFGQQVSSPASFPCKLAKCAKDRTTYCPGDFFYQVVNFLSAALPFFVYGTRRKDPSSVS